MVRSMLSHTFRAIGAISDGGKMGRRDFLLSPHDACLFACLFACGFAIVVRAKDS